MLVVVDESIATPRTIGVGVDRCGPYDAHAFDLRQKCDVPRPLKPTLMVVSIPLLRCRACGDYYFES